jgi:hypothetical protein
LRNLSRKRLEIVFVARPEISEILDETLFGWKNEQEETVRRWEVEVFVRFLWKFQVSMDLIQCCIELEACLVMIHIELMNFEWI